MHTDSSGEPGTLIRDSGVQETPSQPIQESVRLLDSNQIFQPLLSGLGVMPQQLKFTTMTESGKCSHHLKLFAKTCMIFRSWK